MKLLICNPNEKEAKRIEGYVKDYSKISGTSLSTRIFLNPVDLAASKERFEIAVIEMDMSEISGITLGKILTLNMPYIKIIYTSSKGEGIDHAFDVNAVRFYKRPYDKGRFFEGLREAIRRLENETVLFDLADRDERALINKKDIQYIEIENRKTKVVTKNSTYFSPSSIRFWQEHIHSSRFISPHKSFLVNVEYIERYKRNKYIIMKDGSTISIARGKGQDFHAAYIAFKNLML